MLQEKVVIVTGSTTGIGRSIALACAAQGASVVVHGRDGERGEQLVRELGDRALFVAADLAEPASPAHIVDGAVQRFGRLDAVINNAADVTRSNLDSTSADLFDQVLSVNVRAPLLLIQAARPHLRAAKGCVANIGSVNAYGGEQHLLAYSISKGALMTLSKNLANALGPEQIRVAHFNVGWVLTENEYRQKLEDGFPPKWPEQLGMLTTPIGRMTLPEEIAAVVSFWISDASRPFSGTVIELEQYPFAGRNPLGADKVEDA